ncbi:tyrosine-type recombinase/integrase [Lysinibacillus capsici]|uniref:tyrosine-type recombinase/integrase n=1 Tax=Lysinibacillus capsici TaxID=2115968 RepID=UPI00382A5F96
MSKRGWIKSEATIRAFAYENDDISNEGAYLNLMNQLNRIVKHAKGISIHTTLPQYYNHLDLFCRFLADNSNLKNLSNINNKHVVAYVVERQSKGKSAATVKNDLAAIRYIHDQLPSPRYQLSSNDVLAKNYSEFSLEKRVFGGIDRWPTECEYQALLNIAEKANANDIATMIYLAREQGLRVHEITRLSRADTEKAIREGHLTIKGKGGLIRQVPLMASTKNVLQTYIQNIDRGQKLFVPSHLKAHQVIQRVQDFVKNHRDKALDPFHTRPEGVNITMHSFRHAFAKEQYDLFIEAGIEEQEVRLAVSKLIGHSVKM